MRGRDALKYSSPGASYRAVLMALGVFGGGGGVNMGS